MTRRAADHDAVHIIELRHFGMNNGHLGIHGTLDLIAELHDFLRILLPNGEVVLAAIDVEVCCAAVGNIAGYLPERRRDNGHIPLEDE